MAHRRLENKDFEGKTIEKINCSAVNVMTFYFTDGTAIALEAEQIGLGLCGIFACDDCVQECAA